MFPPVMRLGKHVATDTHVKTKIFDNHSLKVLREVDIPIKAGSVVVLDVLGLHMNRRLSALRIFGLLFFLRCFSFLTQRSFGEMMLKILNQRDSSTPKVIAGLAKRVCAVIHFNFDVFQ